MQDQMKALQEQITRTDRELRAMRRTMRFACTVAALAVGALTLSFSKPAATQARTRAMQTERLEIADRNGAVRVTLDANAAGDPVFEMRDRGGKVSTRIRPQRIELLDDREKPRLTLATEADGDPRVELRNQRGRALLDLHLNGDNSHIGMLDPNAVGEAKSKVSLSVLEGGAQLIMTDKDGENKRLFP
jgi:hypothetical protein